MPWKSFSSVWPSSRSGPQALKRKVKGALVYPIVVITFASGILVFIMCWIVPKFEKIFKDFDTKLPDDDDGPDQASYFVVNYWYLLPGIPLAIWLIAQADTQVPGAGAWAGTCSSSKCPSSARWSRRTSSPGTMRTLGTLVASGVPILEALHITKETSGNAVFEGLFQKVYEAIREGESIAKPMKDNSKPPFHPMALFFWFFWPPVIGALLYLTKMNKRILDDMVINMVDVGEETGELDTMLYKVADTYDEEVAVLTESLMSLMEPLMIIMLGGMVGFIVIALFLPLISLIDKLSSH